MSGRRVVRPSKTRVHTSPSRRKLPARGAGGALASGARGTSDTTVPRRASAAGVRAPGAPTASARALRPAPLAALGDPAEEERHPDRARATASASSRSAKEPARDRRGPRAPEQLGPLVAGLRLPGERAHALREREGARRSAASAASWRSRRLASIAEPLVDRRQQHREARRRRRARRRAAAGRRAAPRAAASPRRAQTFARSAMTVSQVVSRGSSAKPPAASASSSRRASASRPAMRRTAPAHSATREPPASPPRPLGPAARPRRGGPASRAA